MSDNNNKALTLPETDQNSSNHSENAAKLKESIDELLTQKFQFDNREMDIFEAAELFANEGNKFCIGVALGDKDYYSVCYADDYKQIYETKTIEEAKFVHQMIIQKLNSLENRKIKANLEILVTDKKAKRTNHRFIIYFSYDIKPTHESEEFICQQLEGIKINEISDELKQKLVEKRSLSEFDVDGKLTMKLSIDAATEVSILRIIELLAESGEKFFIGETSHKTFEQNYKNRINIFYTTKFNEANLMSSILLHKLIFHENRKVRENLLNTQGGGRYNYSTKDWNNFYVYLAYEKKNLLPFQDGELSQNVIQSVVLKVIKTNEKLKEILNAQRMIKFGFTRRNNFELRMKAYQGEGRYSDKYWESYEALNENNFEEQILIKTDDFELDDGTTVKLNFHDIRKCELMFISQLTHLEYKNYSHLLINQGAGGDFEFIDGDNADREALIYFRYGKKGMNIVNFRPE